LPLERIWRILNEFGGKNLSLESTLTELKAAFKNQNPEKIVILKKMIGREKK
jgi:hypothetical protein